jgi:hypothetical protein
MYFYILIDKSALQSFLQAQKGNAVMHNILRPICIAMFVEFSGVGASPNPLDSEADSNCTTTDGTSENNSIIGPFGVAGDVRYAVKISQISMTAEYLGIYIRKSAAGGKFVIAELFYDVDLQDPNESRYTLFQMVNRT